MFAIKFDEKTSAPQKLAFVPKEGLLWGYVRDAATIVLDMNASLIFLQDVDTAVGTGQIGEEDVIELLKLLLYKDHENTHIVQEVESQLGDRSVGDVLELHLAAIIKYAREMVLKEPPFQFSREELEAMEVQLMLAVPLVSCYWDGTDLTGLASCWHPARHSSVSSILLLLLSSTD
jgi:hypothetical protein